MYSFKCLLWKEEQLKFKACIQPMPRKREQERGCQYSRKSVELKADLQKRLRAHTWL